MILRAFFVIPPPSAPPGAEIAIFPEDYQRFEVAKSLKTTYFRKFCIFPPKTHFSSQFRRNGRNPRNLHEFWYLARKFLQEPPSTIGIHSVFVCFQLPAGQVVGIDNLPELMRNYQNSA